MVDDLGAARCATEAIPLLGTPAASHYQAAPGLCLQWG